jgi:hypothetical protein
MSIESAASILRRALTARNRRLNLSGLARDIGLASSALEAFCGGANLPDEALTALTERVFQGHLRFDPKTGTLEPTNKAEPTSIGAPPSSPAPTLFRSGSGAPPA